MIRTSQYKHVKFYEFSGIQDAPFVRKSDGSAAKFAPGCGHEYAEHPSKLPFDMKHDPWEQSNLFGDPAYSRVIEAHEQLLKQWEACLIPGEHYDRN